MLAPLFPERISARTEAVDRTKISCQECVEAVKNATQERISERSQVIEVPKTLRQERAEVVETTPQVRISERTETSSQDRNLQRTVVQMQIMEENFEVDKTTRHERIAERSEAIEVLKTSRQEREVVKKLPLRTGILHGASLSECP